MIKFSKESQITFVCLLIIPVIWSSLNYFGFLDYLKTKSVDWRMQFRGEVSQESFDVNETIVVEGNLSVPKIPKVTYVNFDASTLAMDNVGERPWDRAFFRDMALALIERGNARVVAFDFGFTPKSMSKMVPAENSFRSDMAMGELVAEYPDKVVLGCVYSGVPTPFVKKVGSSAFPPFFKDGFSLESSSSSGNFNYPESPTYPMINYMNGVHIGRLGSFTVPPYRAVDEVPRWVPIWFPSGGKSHAYNLLGGKQSKLIFELPKENSDLIEKHNSELSILSVQRDEIQANVRQSAAKITSLSRKREQLREKNTILKDHEAKIKEVQSVIDNFSDTLKANPAIAAVISPQIEKKQMEIDDVLRFYLTEGEINSSSVPKIDEIVAEQKELKDTLQNLQIAMNANRALSGVIGPQIEIKEKRLKEIEVILAEHEGSNLKSVTPKERKRALGKIKANIQELNEKLEKVNSEVLLVAKELAEKREKLEKISTEISGKQIRIQQLNGTFPTELVEHNNSLMLIYSDKSQETSTHTDFRLVDSLPNQVPLTYEKKFFTLGLEALLAYYGLDQDSVEISGDNQRLRVLDSNGNELISSNMAEGQFVEVNWFSKWTDFLEEEELLRKAKKLYGDGEYKKYLELVRPILKTSLSRAFEDRSDINVENIMQSIEVLGVDSETLLKAEKLLNASHSDEEIPGFETLSQVTTSINYYFVSPRLESDFNPMCGMRDVLENARFQDEIKAKIKEFEEKIEYMEGPGVMGQILSALEQDKDNQDILQKRDQVEDAITINKKNLASQKEELTRINQFFASFNNSIVMIGPEEATFMDLAPTPFNKAPVPKVSVHGNLIKTLTTGKYLKRMSEGMNYLATFIVCIVMGGLAVYQGNRTSLVQAAGILLLIGYIGFGFFTFAETHVIWPITTPACAGLSTSFLGLAAMVVIEQKAKGKLKGMFGSYVSSDLVEQMVESGKEPQLGGEETAITAFFSDVQAFSSFSELLTPTGLVDLMNEYLTAMTNILQEERGTLDKYIGDAIVAMYGAPIPMNDHAYQAVKTAILMQQKQIELREKWVPEAEKWGKCHGLVTQMQTRIGCNTGTATVGNMGALDRFNYTMMGDMVNLAARCESGAKAYGAYIMVTEETKLASEALKDDIAFRYLDMIVVKGRSQPVAMYEPTGFMNELTQETQDCLDCFRQGIDKYLKQDWLGALSLFEKAKELEPNRPGVTPGVKDNPSMILIDRCKVMQENPPGDDWDGVYVMTTK